MVKRMFLKPSFGEGPDQVFHFQTAGKEKIKWKDCFTSILEKSRAIMKKHLPRDFTRKLTPTTHGDRYFFKSIKHITVRLRRTVICLILFGCRSLIISPFFLPEPPRAFYKFGGVGKRSCTEGAAANFFRNVGPSQIIQAHVQLSWVKVFSRSRFTYAYPFYSISLVWNGPTRMQNGEFKIRGSSW